MNLWRKLHLWWNRKAESERGRWLSAVVPPWQSTSAAAWREDASQQVRHYRAWVHAAVSAIAGAVASSPLHLYERQVVGPAREIHEHAFLHLMREVNPFHTRFWLWSATITYLELTGNAYWWVVEDSLGVPRELWLVPSQFMRILPHPQQFIEGYEFRLHGRVVRFSPHEVIHFQYPNPASVYYGVGPLAAAAASVEAHEAIQSAQWHAFRNGAHPSVALTTPQKLDEAVIRRLEQAIHQRYGGTEQAGKVLVLEQGLSVSPISLTPREMDFLRSGEFTREEVLGIFKVPAAIAGIAKAVNRASAEALHRIFVTFTIAPKLQMIAEQLNQDLLARYDRRLFCAFGEPKMASRTQDRADMQARLRLGVTTVNEERQRLGLPAAPWGDAPRV